MTFKCEFEIIKKFCKFVFFIVIFFNSILISKLHANSFKINEIGFFGNWKNNNVKSFIYQPYDFLIYLDLKIIPEMENILIKSLSRCRIGLSYNKLKILEMILKTENQFDIDYRLNKLYHYLKKIK